MKITFQRVLAFSLLILALSLVGCVSDQELRDRADQATQLADNAGTLADQIIGILEDYPADEVEDSRVAEMIRTQIENFNAEWLSAWDSVADTFTSVRVAAIEFVNYIPDLQDNLYARADSLRDQADKPGSGLSNALSLGVNIGLAIFGAGGISAGVVNLINSIKNRNAAVSLIEGVNQVRRASPTVDEGFDGIAGREARHALTPRARALLAKHKL